jgi:hypothetical protein
MPNPLRFSSKGLAHPFTYTCQEARTQRRASFRAGFEMLDFLADYWPFLLLLWIVVAFVLGIVVGRFIRFGMGGKEE